MPAVSPDGVHHDNCPGTNCLRLVIGQADVDRAMRAAESAWPEECCGLLLGQRGGGTTVVTEIVAAPNVSTGDRMRSYEVDPALVLGYLRSGRIARNGLVGFYHSHPDGRGTPSHADAVAAWPAISYLIVACQDGHSAAITSHQWNSGAGRWMPESIVVKRDSQG